MHLAYYAGGPASVHSWSGLLQFASENRHYSIEVSYPLFHQSSAFPGMADPSNRVREIPSYR